jgi:hypothetical protein
VKKDWTHGRARFGGLVHVVDGPQALCGRRIRLAAPEEPLPTCRACLRLAQQRGGVVYLICFDRPFSHAKHYMGWTQNLGVRLLLHRAGRGARLMDAVTQAGIDWKVVAIYYGDRNEERRMKNHGHGRRCPVCRGLRLQASL